MKNFDTTELNQLHDKFKDIFSKKKNISREFQKLHFQITAELLKRQLEKKEIQESIPNITGSIKNVIESGCFKPTEEQIKNEKKLIEIFEKNREKAEKFYNKKHNLVHYLIDEYGNPITPPFYSANELIRHSHHEKIDMSKYTVCISDATEYLLYSGKI